MTIAGLVLRRERLMGIGQAITMPLFFASNALYPVALMPGWLQAVSLVNPLSYEVDALRGLLIGHAATNLARFAVLAGAAVAGILVGGEPARPPRALSAVHEIPARRHAAATERANGSSRPACARHRCVARTPHAWMVRAAGRAGRGSPRGHPSAVRGAPWRAAAKTATARRRR